MNDAMQQPRPLFRSAFRLRWLQRSLAAEDGGPNPYRGLPLEEIERLLDQAELAEMRAELL